jgi:hypothetical protein
MFRLGGMLIGAWMVWRQFITDALTPAEQKLLANRYDADRPWWTATTINTPQSEKGTKANLLRWPWRGRRLRKLLISHRVTLAALQEAGPRTATAFVNAAHWILWLSKPN